MGTVSDLPTHANTTPIAGYPQVLATRSMLIHICCVSPLVHFNCKLLTSPLPRCLSPSSHPTPSPPHHLSCTVSWRHLVPLSCAPSPPHTVSHSPSHALSLTPHCLSHAVSRPTPISPTPSLAHAVSPTLSPPHRLTPTISNSPHTHPLPPVPSCLCHLAHTISHPPSYAPFLAPRHLSPRTISPTPSH